MRSSSFRFGGLLLFALLIALGCGSRETRAARHLARGEEYQKAGQQEEALIEYRSALQLEPSSADVNYRIAEILQSQGKYPDALFYYRETHRLDPKRVDAAMAEAKLLLFQDKPRAKELIDDALAQDPANPVVHLRRMDLALADADTQTALSEILTAIQLAPKDGIYQYNLGTVHLARIRELSLKGETVPDEIRQAAADAYRKADELYGGNLVSLLALAKTYAVWPGHDAETRAALDRALEVAKKTGVTADRKQAAGAMADYAALVHDDALRERALNEKVAADPDDIDAWAELAARAEARGESGEALYQRLLKERPKDFLAHVAYARYLAGKGRLDDACKHLQETADQGIEPAGALDERVRLELAAGRKDDANATLAHAKELYPDANRTRLAGARVALAEGRPQEAAEALRVVAGKIESADVQSLLASAELALGNAPAAAAAIERALQLTPGFSAPLLEQKATILAVSRDWVGVLQTLRTLEQGGAHFGPQAQILLAQAYYEARNPAEGRKVLERMLADKATLPMAALIFAEREGNSDPKAAIKYLSAALEADPGQPPLVASLARLEARSDPASALRRLDAALATPGAPAGLRLLRAQILATQGQLDRAEAYARQVVQDAPNLPGATTLMVLIYTERGNLDGAISTLEKANQAGSLDAGSRSLLARLYLSRGDVDRARDLLERALAERSDLPDAKNDLAFVLASQGQDLDRALSLAQDAQRALPQAAEVADTLGYVYLKKGLSSPAIDQFRFALELAGQQPMPSVQYHLGLALAQGGRNEEAAAALEKALAAGTSFPDAAAAREALERARAAASSSASGPS